MLESAAQMTAEPLSIPDCASAIVAEQLLRPATGWAVGMIGAVAEFMRAAIDEPASERPGCVITPRGALKIGATPDTRAVRFTTHSGLACIALCLPEAQAWFNGRAALTEVGPDHGAARSRDRDAILFDLGIDSPFFDFCVRTDDPAAVQRLRRLAGARLFGNGPGALSEIAALQPHRIVCSRLARIEVYQPIAAAGGATPDGPHTHLLPDLLAARLPFASDEPIPHGWIPCAHLYLGQLPGHQGWESAHPGH
jgi:hypothetical protein